MLTFPEVKRRLVGWVALLAPLPLPFNEIVHPVVVLIYLGLVVAFLRRLRRPQARWLPNWLLNVLAITYLPFFFFDTYLLSGGRLVRPVVHLLLFAVVVKLFAFQRERDKWQALVAALFLFLASMATSVHVSVVLYLVVFLVVAITLLARFACLNVLAGFGRRDPTWAELPLSSFLVPATLATLAIAVPFFVGLPRVKAPFLIGRGAPDGTSLEAGISGEVDLDTIGRARENPEVVLRLRYRQEPPAPEELRFRVRAHDIFRGNAWQGDERIVEMLHRFPGGSGLRLAVGRAVNTVEVLQLPVLDFALALPVEALEIRMGDFPLPRTALGVVPLPSELRNTRGFTVTLAAKPVAVAGAPPEAGSPSLDASGLSAEILALGRERAAGETTRQRAAAVERYLQREFEYTEALIGSGVSVDDFLFRYKSGHCEYFATAMVLLLRGAGIPARLVTGYLGAEANPFQSFHVVRQSNAHAWVEVYLPEEGGWQVFDPTPASGRPAARRGLTGLLSQAYDLLVMQWDRYVLTYGLNDQFRLFVWAREAWRDFWGTFSPRPKGKAALREAPAAPGAPGEDQPAAPAAVSAWWLLAALPALAAALWIWRRRQRSGPRATRLYDRLRRALARAGTPVEASTAPLAVRALARRQFPDASEPIDGTVAAYLEESFGGVPLAPERAAELALAIRRLEKRRPAPLPAARGGSGGRRRSAA